MNAQSVPQPPHLRLVVSTRPDPDRTLVERLHRRDRTALADVYRAHHAAVRAAAAPICAASAVDDVVQDVFLVVAQRPSSMPLDGFADYLVRLARSLARERASGRRRDVCLDDLDAIARRRVPRPKRKPGAD